MGGWASPPPHDCTCRVKPRLKSPPRGAANGLPHPCAARDAPDGLPHALPCPPESHCRAPAPVLPPHEGRGGGAAPCRGGGGGGTTLSPTLALSLTPLTQSSSLWLPLCLHHILPCSTLLPQTLPCSILLPQTLSCSILLPLITEGWGGTLTLPIPLNLF